MAVEFEHGTRNGYAYYRCRCEECRDASAAYYRERRGQQPRSRKHGTTYSYGLGCRCDLCVEGRRRDVRAYRARVAAKVVKPAAAPRFAHGTLYAWTKKRCRCDVCRQWKLAQAGVKSQRFAHGTYYAWTVKCCRCEICLAWRSAASEGSERRAVAREEQRVAAATRREKAVKQGNLERSIEREAVRRQFLEEDELDPLDALLEEIQALDWEEDDVEHEESDEDYAAYLARSET